jgi:hypothetical protein
MNILQILVEKYSDSEWLIQGDSYEGLEWLSDSPKPTKQELQSQWAEVQSKIAAAEEAKADAKASAISKLQALGLTIEEVEVAFGLSE